MGRGEKTGKDRKIGKMEIFCGKENLKNVIVNKYFVNQLHKIIYLLSGSNLLLFIPSVLLAGTTYLLFGASCKD